ncbi:terminus macrodomain insulation protein YfbV [Pectobacterium sp. B1J-3]|uniref:terminus macrodomain insulation protein YfbV n=1 Tax=Pectobacterium sp. B1J-3 TaxID=3385371 RepID=UPI003906B569
MATKPSDRISWLKLLQRGQHYMKTWPADKRLAPVFPENRVVRATQFAIRFMPPLAVFTLTWQIALGGQLGPAIATALFACSLPMHGLWWLGRRSVTPLPPTLLTWFHDIRHKLLESGLALAPLEDAPTYQSLADVLKRAFKQLDKTFLDDL